MKEYDSTLTNRSSPSITCLFSFDFILIKLFLSLNFIMLFNSSSSNISHFEHLSSSTNTIINSFNEFILSTTNKSSHSPKPDSTQMNNSRTSCTRRKAMLTYSILDKVLSFDVIFFVTKKPSTMIVLTIKMQSSSTSIMLSLIFHQWTSFFMIFIEHIPQDNSQQMITLLFVILTVSVHISPMFSFIGHSFFSADVCRCHDRTTNVDDCCKYVLDGHSA